MEDEGSWSDGAVLEYFRVVAEFLKVEERKGWGPAGGGPAAAPLPRRRRATMTRRTRPQTQGHASQGGGRGEGDGLFTWQRSYTR